MVGGVELLVMDEADLLFSFGYEDNIHSLLPLLPSIYQAILLSATLSDVRTQSHVDPIARARTHTHTHTPTYA